MEDDNNENIKCPKDSLCKFHFTMKLVFNAGTDDKYFVWCDIIFKGTETRILAAEKERWDKDVDVFW